MVDPVLPTGIHRLPRRNVHSPRAVLLPPDVISVMSSLSTLLLCCGSRATVDSILCAQKKSIEPGVVARIILAFRPAWIT